MLRAKKEAKHHLIFYFHTPNLTRTDHFPTQAPKGTPFEALRLR